MEILDQVDEKLEGSAALLDSPEKKLFLCALLTSCISARARYDERRDASLEAWRSRVDGDQVVVPVLWEEVLRDG
jgi:hypothetical protein